MKTRCGKCGREFEELELVLGKCRQCRDREDEDNRPKPGPGDLFGTGLPGGIDFDFTTPY